MERIKVRVSVLTLLLFSVRESVLLFISIARTSLCHKPFILTSPTVEGFCPPWLEQAHANSRGQDLKWI